MRIEFENFRCLRKTALDLTPLTVIVGPNASGKSSILEALDPEYMPQPSDMWQRRPDPYVALTRIADDGRRSTCAFKGGRQHVGGVLYRYQALRLDADMLRNQNTVQPQQQLAVNGSNLTNVFDTLDRETQAKLVKEFCALVPVFSDVNAIPSGTGNKHLVFTDRWNGSAKYVPHEVSDGSLLVLAFLVLRYQALPPDILAVEELERGLHPYLIEELIAFLRRIARGELGGKKTRVVIATHSPEVLSCAQPEEVRVLKRSVDGSVEIASLDSNTTNMKQALEAYEGSLGGLWLSGNLGGVPGAA